ncbi:MAG: fatty acid desaturase [Myxococcales bacterium 68-20]|nr:fatty acid desaturase [Myxococcales bacterium]OJY18316.1 MAG: fatty acid desaturase [Myxococcales bacterium 68-20]
MQNAASPTPFDPDAIDFEGFFAELKVLRREIDASLGEADLAHLRKIERLGWAATALGLTTAWIAPNPLSMASLSFGRSTRWLLMHHIGHRGYDKVPNVPARWTSKVFARGARRFIDWPDWMIPEAWIYEHNVLHHSHTGEERDPDLLERNTESLRGAKVPKAAKYGAMGLLALSWRPVYYAPNTLRAWLGRLDKRRAKTDAPASPPQTHTRELWLRCYLPYTALEFGLLPLAFLPLGPWAVASALANSVGAEALTNLHTFLVVGPNHSGEDLYRFMSPAQSRGEAMVRQVIGSANYAVGGDAVDLAHLWLNYQIEHHIWPDLPLLRYREVQPKVKALCAKYGIPYVQESVLTRVKKMLAIAVGSASMKRAPTEPAEDARARRTERVDLGVIAEGVA